MNHIIKYIGLKMPVSHFNKGVVMVCMRRELTVKDRQRILKNDERGWKRASKEKFAEKWNLSPAQVRAVIAWKHKNLGGEKYRETYLYS